MPRIYEFLFRGPDGRPATYQGVGNTRGSAEISARHKLRRDQKLETTAAWIAVKTTFVGRQ